MSKIIECLNKITAAVYGKDVRQAIVDAIKACYEDGKAGAIDLTAREHITQLSEEKADKSMVGSPLVATTPEGMTDRKKVYVYAGEDTEEYVRGNWYYYDDDGSAWISGGVYNSAAVVTDTGLSQEGVPADAAATGAAIESLTKELISSLNGNIYVGSTQPTNGIEYWLDTSEDGDSGGEETDTPIIANTYTITRTLTRCTSSSTATIITEGSCYKEIITAEDGYTLSGATVNITMGDVDISDNYVNGELIIDEVSGDIVISIIAVTDNWEDITLTYNAYAYGTIYSDEGTTELATGTRGGAMSDIFEEDTYVSVTCTITGVAGYIGYCGEYSYRETHLYNATILPVGATTTVEMWIPEIGRAHV